MMIWDLSKVFRLLGFGLYCLAICEAEGPWHGAMDRGGMRCMTSRLPNVGTTLPETRYIRKCKSIHHRNETRLYSLVCALLFMLVFY